MQQKLITFAVPCYNSAAYMRHCIETLLSAGEQAEIILVDDGSVKDDTPAICDEYAAKYPTIVKAIHQENGGHGEGVNQGIRNATGLYYKVVDSDDWLDTDALQKVLARLHTLVTRGTAPDLMICNYVYEHTEDGTSHTVRYTNIFPQERLFTWMHVGHFRPDQNLLMHSVMYRTEVLRKCGMVLPKHTFYVDNIFVYQPLPFVKTMYYMDLDLYRYFIGREDQSVNDAVLHGVPYDYNLKDGDLVSLDLAINVDGWVADSAISFCVGTQHPDDLRLIKCTEEALAAGIEAAQPGNRLGDVSCAVGDVAREYGYPINLEFGGHGVGHIMHGDPHVPNDGKAHHGYKLRPGLVIAIEPWFLKTTDEIYQDPKDGWTLKSEDGSRGAHSEHTIAITENGPVILTVRD